jgi:hypothetical protein
MDLNRYIIMFTKFGAQFNFTNICCVSNYFLLFETGLKFDKINLVYEKATAPWEKICENM